MRVSGLVPLWAQVALPPVVAKPLATVALMESLPVVVVPAALRAQAMPALVQAGLRVVA